MNSKTKIGSFICIALTLILMTCQLLPFWTVPETGESHSIGAYVAHPLDLGTLESYLKAETGEGYNINSVVVGPVMLFLLGAVGIVLCIMKSDLGVCALLPAAAGGFSAWGYLTQTALQIGSGWILHLILAILLIVVGLFTFIISLKEAQN